MEQGWVKVHRSIMDKPIWTEATAEQKVILMTLLLLATHARRQWEWKGTQYSLQPGQLITSLPSLVMKCGKGVTVQKVRTALKRFTNYGFLTDESTHQNRLITIVNWDVYQQNDRSSTDVLPDIQQMEIRHVTPNKNVKNEKKERTDYQELAYDGSSEFYRLALALQESVRRNHPSSREPDLTKWANDMRAIVENDQRSTEQVHQLITWSQKHHFWNTVILSPVALRRNWDQLVAQMQQESVRKRGQVYQLPSKREVEEFVLDLTKGEAW